MSKNKSSSVSMWDDFSEKLESLREAVNTPTEENDSSSTPHVESESVYHFSDNDTLSLKTFDIESLRKALNTPIDEIIAAEQAAEEADVPSQNDEDSTDSGISDSMNAESDEIESPSIPEMVTETVDETEAEHITYPDNQVKKTDDSAILYDTQESQDTEETIDVNEPDIEDINGYNNLIQKTGEYGKSDDIQEYQFEKEDSDTSNEPILEDILDLDNQIQQPYEVERPVDIQESQYVKGGNGSSNEPFLGDIIDPNYHTQKSDDADKLVDTQESQDVKEEDVSSTEPVPEDILAPNIQNQQPDKAEKLDDMQESHNTEIKIKTERSIKSEKLDNYWKEGEKANPYLQKVDKSREELNKSLEMARELVNRQSEEPPKPEKKRFQLKFARGGKNGSHKSTTEKGKRSKNTSQLKPMVYEMLEPKQENQDNHDNHDNHANQVSKVKQEKGHKEKNKRSDDRAKNAEEKEIINHRNRLERSRSLGVPVFVKKPVNLEQIRQLKSMLISQNNLKILVDTGSSQGRLLVISGQDPDTLLNTLSQLTIIKSTTVEDETINLVMN